jgi:hypothetical protein
LVVVKTAESVETIADAKLLPSVSIGYLGETRTCIFVLEKH